MEPKIGVKNIFIVTLIVAISMVSYTGWQRQKKIELLELKRDIQKLLRKKETYTTRIRDEKKEISSLKNKKKALNRKVVQIKIPDYP